MPVPSSVPWKSPELHAGIPDTFILEYRGHSIDLEEALLQLAGRLREEGMEPGMTLATTAGDRLLDLLLLLLLPLLGGRLLILDPALPPARTRQLLAIGGADLVLREEGGVERLASRRPQEQGGISGGWEKTKLLLATSGTTGEPRLVELTYGNLRAGARAANALLDLAPGDRWLACLPTHHVGSIAILFRCLLAGSGVVLQERFDSGSVLEALESGTVTHLSLVPSMLQRLLDEAGDSIPPATLRVVLLGGAPAPASLVQAALERGWPVCPSYGLTEAASQVATLYPPPHQWEQGLVGKPLPHVQVGIDREGRIRLRGPSIARYRLDATGRHRQVDVQGWFTTSDLGQLDGEGRLRVLGRVDDLIISGGEKLHPAFLEAELARCPGVAEVAVVGVEDARWGERLMACYTGEVSEADLERWAREHLQRHHRPRGFLRFEALPRNALGKLLRRQLRELVAERLEAR